MWYEISSGALSNSSPILTIGMPGCMTWIGVWNTLESARISGWPPHADVDSIASQYCRNLDSAVFSPWTPACDSSRSEMNGIKSALCWRMYRAAAMRSMSYVYGSCAGYRTLS